MATVAANAFARLEAIEPAEVTESSPILSHEQKRRLFAMYVYVLVQVLIMWLYLAIATSGQIGSEILSLGVFATGIGGHQIAMQATKRALLIYDHAFPPE